MSLHPFFEVHLLHDSLDFSENRNLKLSCSKYLHQYLYLFLCHGSPGQKHFEIVECPDLLEISEKPIRQKELQF